MALFVLMEKGHPKLYVSSKHEDIEFLTLVLPMGEWRCCTPQGFSRLLQNAQESDLEHQSNDFYILWGHFDDKEGGVYNNPVMGKASTWEGEGFAEVRQ